MKQNELVKCDRCGQIKPFSGQYTYYEPDKLVDQVVEVPSDKHGTTRRAVTVNMSKSRGFCTECAIEFNKQQFDLKNLISLQSPGEKKN